MSVNTKEAISLYKQVIVEHPILSPTEELELAKKVRTGDKIAKERFIYSNLCLVMRIAKLYSNVPIDFLDLVQEGNLGLLKAVEMFDYTKGYRFSTYATFWIKEFIQKAIINQVPSIRVSSYMKKLINKYQSIQNAFFLNNGRYGTDVEISNIMEIPISQLQEIKSFIYSTVSMYSPISTDEDTTFEEILRTAEPTPDEMIMNLSDKDTLNDLISISNLSEKEKSVIQTCYDLENNTINSLRTVGKKLGLSQEGVRLIEKRALQKLKYNALQKHKNFFF